MSDSYDLWQALQYWGNHFKDVIRQSGGTLIIRPDSGNPVEIVLKTLQLLEEYFGCTINSKGYKLLPPYIRVIQGDGVSLTSIEAILQNLTTHGYSTDNVAFGMGAELLQKVNRDTLKFAMKASAAQINGQWYDVYKDPITDPGKQSKRGRLALIRNEQGHLETILQTQLGNRSNLLKSVFHNGQLLVNDCFEQIRNRAAI